MYALFNAIATESQVFLCQAPTHYLNLRASHNGFAGVCGKGVMRDVNHLPKSKVAIFHIRRLDEMASGKLYTALFLLKAECFTVIQFQPHMKTVSPLNSNSATHNKYKSVSC